MAESTILPLSWCDRLYQSSRGHPRTYSHILFSKNNFSKILWALSEKPWCSRPPFSNSPSRAMYTQIFSRLSTPIYACGEAVEPNLQRQPYAPTSNVTLHKISSLNYNLYTTYFLLYHGFTKALTFKNFWALSRGPWGSIPPFSNSPPRAT